MSSYELEVIVYISSNLFKLFKVFLIKGVGWKIRNLIFQTRAEDEIRKTIDHLPALQKCLTSNKIWEESSCPDWDVNWSPLHFAAYHGQNSVIKLLVVEFGAYINAKQNVGSWTGTPLHAAIKGNHADAASLLLSHGADVLLWGSHSDGTRFDCALHYAKMLGNRGPIEHLLTQQGIKGTHTYNLCLRFSLSTA